MWMEKKLRQHKLHKLLHFVRFSLKSYECYHMVELCAHSWTLYFFAIFLKHLSQPMMISLQHCGQDGQGELLFQELVNVLHHKRGHQYIIHLNQTPFTVATASTICCSDAKVSTTEGVIVVSKVNVRESLHYQKRGMYNRQLVIPSIPDVALVIPAKSMRSSRDGTLLHP